MALSGVPFEDYSGLDLRSAANESGGAIDALNVEVDAPGRLRTRDGFTKFSGGSPPSSAYTNLTVVGGSGSTIILGLSGNTQFAANTGSAPTLSSTLAQSVYNSVAYGVPGSTTVAYGPVGTSTANIIKYNGSTFSNVATGLGAGTYGQLANVTPVDNRLMLLRFSGLVGTEAVSTVVFSNPGAPETFVASNFVQLSPGDGEEISGVCNFGNQTFVFKQSRFFVFTGTTSDASGNPIFNYRTVASGIGIPAPFGTADRCVATPQGVFFMGFDGVYRTSGGTPVKVSQALDPLFGASPLQPYFQASSSPFSGVTQAFLHHHRGRLYMSLYTPTVPFLFVYDLETQQWMCHDLQVAAMCSIPNVRGMYFAYSGLNAPTATNDIGQFSSSATTDAGTAITGRYRTGFFTFDYRGRTPTRAIAGVEKIVRETIVDGTGTVSYTLSNQWVLPANLPGTRSLVLGTSPQVAQKRDRTAVKGRAFSMQFSGTAPWTVERTVLNVHGYEGTGLKET